MNVTKHQRIKTIIHSSATAAATAGAGLAQAPGSDSALITPIQIAMIVSIGKVHQQELSFTAATSTLSAVSAGYVGRAVSQVLVGWIPGLGNVINASTAFAITEAIGWGANALLERDSPVARRR
ncbi:hypothetical protein [Psychromonas ossibalaenae]|uniref:hypothetical protein n=1 Tax=Psychromonas ossibalaenae TaxID=444922 RepID=UPI000369825E|nr:hypothetical protein [Psychromonas ossibalaenae]